MAAEIGELPLELVGDPIHNNQWNMDSSMTTKVSSYALLFNPKDGAKLKYITTQSINSISCAKIEAKNVASEIQYWNSVVLCCLLGVNPPFEVIDGFSIDKVAFVRKGVSLVRFNNIEDRDAVISKGMFFFDKKPFLVKPWNENLHIDTASISRPVTALFGGITNKIDKPARDKTMLNYARMLFEVDLNSSFLETVEFINAKDMMIATG
ncbi:hypothetical protein Cgig2_021635 [Carnegiea gigantea]|uniref:DUF4283 domain-containing protein n=1 Tax=Carnegiea gigantea TaxID=171969 RepID=A0A9Q1GV14_9CARY|nr:hypothetical protein Cgig2_021635 [Carnegiea gigantea]